MGEDGTVQTYPVCDALLWAGGLRASSIRERQKKALIEPTGLAAVTESQWLPEVLRKPPDIKCGDVGAITVNDPKSGARSIVYYAYFRPWDWIITFVAASRDSQGATDRVRTQFDKLH